MKWLRWLWEDFKAYRRGERRIAPRGARGRIYERKAGPQKRAGWHEAKGGVKKIEVRARVLRASGEVEDLGVISSGRPDKPKSRG